MKKLLIFIAIGIAIIAGTQQISIIPQDRFKFQDSVGWFSVKTFYDAKAIWATGHSIPQGTGGWDATHGFTWFMDSFYRRPFANFSLGGTGVAYATNTIYVNENPLDSAGLIIMMNTNDLLKGGPTATFQRMTTNGAYAIAANHFTKDTITASGSGVTTTGTWTTTAGKANSAGKSTNLASSSVQNSTLTYTSPADSSLILTLVAKDAGGGVAKVEIDGVTIERVQLGASQVQFSALVTNSNHSIPVARIYSGLAYTTHTIRITNDSTAGTILVDWFGHLKDRRNCYPMVLFSDPYIPITGYAGYNTGASNASFDSLAANYTAWRATQPAWLPIYIAYSNNSGFNQHTMIGSDSTHPNILGHYVIATNGLAALGGGVVGHIYRSGRTMILNAYTDAFNNKQQTVLIGSTVGSGYIPIANALNQYGSLTNSIIRDSAYTMTFRSPFGQFQRYTWYGSDQPQGQHMYAGSNEWAFGTNWEPLVNSVDVGNRAASGFIMTSENALSRFSFYGTNTNGVAPTLRMQLTGDGELKINSTTSTGTVKFKVVNAGNPQMMLRESETAGTGTTLRSDNNGTFNITPEGVTTKFVAGTTAKESINIPAGAQLTTPVTGALTHVTNHLYFVSGSTTYDLLVPANIYNTDGTLTGNRAVTNAGFNLAVTGTGKTLIGSATNNNNEPLQITGSTFGQLGLYYDATHGTNISTTSAGDLVINLTSNSNTINPGTDNLYDIGTSGAGGRWRTLYANSVVTRPIVSSIGTLTLSINTNFYSFTGSTTTWTLPALAAGTIGTVFYIKNRGSGSITLQRAGSDNLYTTTSVTSITIAAGASAIVWSDASFWNVQ